MSTPRTEAEPEFDEADNMCPNCVTPWKCNGPHLADQTVADTQKALDAAEPFLAAAMAAPQSLAAWLDTEATGAIAEALDDFEDEVVRTGRVDRVSQLASETIAAAIVERLKAGLDAS